MKIKPLFFIWIICLSVLAGACKEYVHVGPNWDALHKMQLPENTFNVKVTGPGKAAPGDDLSFKVTSAESGRLWVVQVGSDDTMSVLFPNDLHKNNTISSHSPVSIPPREADWEIIAQKPLGETIVAFVVTTGETDLSDVLNQDKSMSKAIIIVASSPAWGMARQILEIHE